MSKKDINFNFSLDSIGGKTEEINLLKTKSAKNDNDIAKKLDVLNDKINVALNNDQQKSVNREIAQEDTGLIQVVSPHDMLKLSKHIKNKKTKSHRLQVFITDEVYFAIQDWKRIMGLKKDTDAVEALFRLALGLKQI